MEELNDSEVLLFDYTLIVSLQLTSSKSFPPATEFSERSIFKRVCCSQ